MKFYCYEKISGMKSGLYVVRAVKDGKTQQRKLIKK